MSVAEVRGLFLKPHRLEEVQRQLQKLGASHVPDLVTKEKRLRREDRGPSGLLGRVNLLSMPVQHSQPVQAVSQLASLATF